MASSIEILEQTDERLVIRDMWPYNPLSLIMFFPLIGAVGVAIGLVMGYQITLLIFGMAVLVFGLVMSSILGFLGPKECLITVDATANTMTVFITRGTGDQQTDTWPLDEIVSIEVTRAYDKDETDALHVVLASGQRHEINALRPLMVGPQLQLFLDRQRDRS
jgi:hypothetical protein